MKKIGLFIWLLSFFLFYGCDSLNEIKTIDLDTTIKHSVPVNIAETDPSSVEEDFSVDASSNSEVSKYLDKIQEYTVNKITYKIKNYSGAAGILLDGQAKFGSNVADISNLNLSEAAGAGTVFEFDLDQNALKAIANDLENGNEISGSLEGTVSGKPVSFTVEFEFDISLKAEVL
jgi:hypothetical protein